MTKNNRIMKINPPENKVVKILVLIILIATGTMHKTTNSILKLFAELSKIKKINPINIDMITIPKSPKPAKPFIAHALALAPEPDPLYKTGIREDKYC